MPDSLRLNGRQLILLSCAALFWELTMIRYVPGAVRVVGYFTNLVLLSTFLGLGAGTILAKRIRNPIRWFAPLVVITSFAALLLGAGDTLNPEGQFIWHGGPVDSALAGEITLYDGLRQWATQFGRAPAELVIGLISILLALLFVPLGAAIGVRFSRMEPLSAYAYDIGGSLLGIVLFTVLSAWGTTPVVWFSVGFVLVASLLFREKIRWLAVFAVAAALALGAAWILTSAFEWSPYQKLAVKPVTTQDLGGQGDQTVGYELKVNNDYHQMMLNLGPSAAPHPPLLAWRGLYDAPYEGRAPGDVLILGAGSGNDVMAALRADAQSVTAVDIDPVIVKLGRKLHHEKPYDDPRVQVHINDARAFIKQTDQTYDTVVFGFLDSHTLLASMSSVRIDTFVYTLESFQNVRRIVRPGGKVVLTFAATQPWIGARLFRLFKAAFGTDPDVSHYDFTNGVVFSVTPSESAPDPAKSLATADEFELPTDDWPYFYLESHSIPCIYFLFIFMTVLLGVVPMLLVPKGERQLNLQFLFLGAGFMLIETRSVTEMALLFGSTWIVNSITFGGILLMVFLANLACMRWKAFRPTTGYALVAACVVLHAVIPSEVLLSLGVTARVVLTIALLFSPIFFAGMCFSSSFRNAEKPHVSFGSNLLGAMIGGGLEYLAMLFGFAFLDGVALTLYGLAALAYLRTRA